jgi:hypothetical protein
MIGIPGWRIGAAGWAVRMALTTLSFREPWDADDFHVVRGASAPRLAEKIELRDPAVASHAIRGVSPPPHITLRFRPHFEPEGPQGPDVTSGHDVSVDERTGLITVLPVSDRPRRLRNFLVTISARDTNTLDEKSLRVRVHVHDAITRAWMTPSTLTVRTDGGVAKFSLFAEFDDKVIGDLSNWWASSQMTWSVAVQPPHDPADIVMYNSSIGWVRGHKPGAVATMSVVYPGLSWPDPPPTGTVWCVENWASPRELTWIAGRDPRKWPDVPNLLFLPDGFVDGERELFLTLVKHIVRKLQKSSILRPFDLLKDEMNFWAAFVPSGEPGVNILYEVYDDRRYSGREYEAVPRPKAPAESAETWSLSELVHEVGLPVEADWARDLGGDDGFLAVWRRVYGSKVTEARVEDEWREWRALATRTLLNERDTLFGLGLGSRPRAAGNGLVRSLVLRENERVPAKALNELLVNLHHDGEAVGGVWRIFDPDGLFPAGKDEGLVCILSRTRLNGGTNRGGYYTSSLHDRTAHRVRPGALAGLDIVPLRIKTKAMAMPAGEEGHRYVDVDDPPFEAVGTVAHETAHSLHLGDEYGENTEPGWKAPAPGSILDFSTSGNLQDHQSLLVAGRLHTSNCKWAWWHRIEKAGMLAASPPPTTEREFRVTLRPGHAQVFRKDDLIRLRARPLIPSTRVSHVLRVKATPSGGQAHLDVEVMFRVGEPPASFEADDVVLKMVRWPRSLGTTPVGTEFTLMAENIRQHINTIGLPLNASPDRALSACDLDASNQQGPKNLPDGLPKCQPRNKSRIVGLFEGGSQYHCEVYHPTGACIMRSRINGDELLPFCHVCRYVLVDLVDPTKHGIIDRDYAKIYPDPRT